MTNLVSLSICVLLHSSMLPFCSTMILAANSTSCGVGASISRGEHACSSALKWFSGSSPSGTAIVGTDLPAVFYFGASPEGAQTVAPFFPLRQAQSF